MGVGSGGSGVKVAVGGGGVKVAVGGGGVKVAVGGSGVKVAVGGDGVNVSVAGGTGVLVAAVVGTTDVSSGIDPPQADKIKLINKKTDSQRILIARFSRGGDRRHLTAVSGNPG